MLSAKHGGDVKVTRLQPGEALEIMDRIHIDRMSNPERYMWTGSVDIGGAAVFGYSVNEDYDTPEEAEAGAIRWAESHGAAEVYIENKYA